MIPKLLQIANSGCRSPEFYRLKDKILHQRGKLIGYDVQYIEKECYSCGGTGIHNGYYGKRSCWNCTDGIYSRRYYLLERWKFGKYVFHRPVKSCKWYECGPVTINGYIRHKIPQRHLAEECYLWLALIFDQELFKREMRESCWHHSAVTPLLIWRNCHRRKNLRHISPMWPKRRLQDQYFWNQDEIPF